MTRIYSVLILAAMTAQSGTPLAAQNQSHETPPAFASGLTAGTMHFTGGRTDDAMSIALQYSPVEWLALSAAPGFGRTTVSGTSSVGLTDIPLSAGAWHTLRDVSLSPTISAALYSSLALASASSPIGIGRSVIGASAAVSARATDNLHVTIGAAHPLTGNSGNGSVQLESSYSVGKATANAGFTTEVGTADSGAVLSRSVAGGVAYSVAGLRTLTVDASRGLTTAAPAWSFSVGFGTAFAGLSPVNPTSALRRLKSVFGSRAMSTSGYSKGSCKRSGTC